MAPFEALNIPQKPPMVMVDRLIEVSGSTTMTSFVIRPENPFCEGGMFREPGLIENMAQTAAAGVGSKPGVAPGAPPLGFIGGLRNLKVHAFPKVGDEITTQVTVEHEVFDATVVQGTVFCHGQIMAECELKIFLIKNV